MTLTSTRDRDSIRQRHITLSPGFPVTIGRASKSEAKQLQAAEDNALFDCPVVSRNHAELRMHGWSEVSTSSYNRMNGALTDAVKNQVTITDIDSMHGTTLNGSKISANVEHTLQPGDMLKFGERVTRGSGEYKRDFFPILESRD